MKLRVFCNPEHVARQNSFLKPSGISGPTGENRLLPFHLKTGWAKISLVEAQCLGYKYILQEFGGPQNVEMIYFVSGYDIPIMSAKKLLEMPPISRIPILEMFDFKAYSRNRVFTFVRSVQWIHLTGYVAELLGSLSKKSIKSIGKRLDNYNKNKGRPDVYDEIIPATILKILGVRFSEQGHKYSAADDALTDFERHENDNPSPIEWSSLDQKIRIATEQGHRKRSLRQIIVEDMKDEFVFFRKVKSNVVFSNEFLREIDLIE
jgi:hypothetical protein